MTESMISLVKGQKIDLTKGNAGLTKVLVGLGWDQAQRAPQKKSLLGSLLGGGQQHEIDCDASVLLLDERGRLTSKNHVIYFGNLESPNRSVRHSGDNLTGAGAGDDEQVFIDLQAVPADVHRLVFVVNIYDCANRKQDFGGIANAFIRVADQNGGAQLCRFNLTDDYSGRTALVVGEMYRHGAEWKFAAIGEGTTDVSLGQLVARYQ